MIGTYDSFESQCRFSFDSDFVQIAKCCFTVDIRSYSYSFDLSSKVIITQRLKYEVLLVSFFSSHDSVTSVM